MTLYVKKAKDKVTTQKKEKATKKNEKGKSTP